LGDGIEAIDPARHEELVESFRRASAAGRFSKFVPASGAASRMFKSLLPHLAEPPGDRRELQQRREAGDATAAAVLRFGRELPGLPFFGQLREAVERNGRSLEEELRQEDHGALLEWVLTPPGLDLAALPKGLIPFHRYPGEARTAFLEHLVEGAGYLADRRGRCRLHFTVPSERRELFARCAAEAAPRLRKRLGVTFQVTLSIQESSTDTLAIDGRGRPMRRKDGSLLLRPGGHGALLQNLAALGGDLVFIKNIDNILPESRHAMIARWKHLLGGLLTSLEEEAFAHLEALQRRTDAEALDAASAFLHRRFGRTEDAASGISLEGRRRSLCDQLDRPLRVCGMVPNAGEPGGGPFWVASAKGGSSRQIVERAEIDSHRPEQVETFESSSHFNPVDLVCSLRSWRGEAFELARFADPQAVFVARKTEAGRELLALERPGLWNGAMAHWNTVFVEVPAPTFAPVKTIFDLLRPEHQPG
jgi:hypothetical protein